MCSVYSTSSLFHIVTMLIFQATACAVATISAFTLAAHLSIYRHNCPLSAASRCVSCQSVSICLPRSFCFTWVHLLFIVLPHFTHHQRVCATFSFNKKLCCSLNASCHLVAITYYFQQNCNITSFVIAEPAAKAKLSAFRAACIATYAFGRVQHAKPAVDRLGHTVQRFGNGTSSTTITHGLAGTAERCREACLDLSVLTHMRRPPNPLTARTAPQRCSMHCHSAGFIAASTRQLDAVADYLQLYRRDYMLMAESRYGTGSLYLWVQRNFAISPGASVAVAGMSTMVSYDRQSGIWVPCITRVIIMLLKILLGDC